jgi:hypothetical protein
MFAVLWNRNATFCLGGTGKSRIKKCEANFLGNNNGSDIQKAKFCLEIVLGDPNVVWIRNLSRNRTQNFKV